MPISGRPLLEYWLSTLYQMGITDVLVNTHHHRRRVEEFLDRTRFRGWVQEAYEPKLLGTAGTLTTNLNKFQGKTVMLIHADNWCQCDFSAFIDFHCASKPSHAVITMMTFRCDKPEECGIVQLDDQGVVTAFHEKIQNPPGKLANGAVYLLEPKLLTWLKKYPDSTNFSTDILPRLLGYIATWENREIHRDIGTIGSLQKAQSDKIPVICWQEKDQWQHEFEKTSIFQELSEV